MLHALRASSARLLGPALFALSVLSCGAPDQPDPTSKAPTTSIARAETAIEGLLQIVFVRDWEGTSSYPEHYLERAGGDWIKLSFERRHDLIHQGDPLGGHDHLALPPLARLRVLGRQIAPNLFEVSDVEMMAPPPAGNISAVKQALLTPSPKKVAVILANFANDTSQPLTADAVRTLVFTGASSANAYYKEISYGARSLTGKLRSDGDVFGWYTITSSNNPCDYVTWGNAARAAAQAAGVDLSGYDQIIHYFPRATTCSWSGVGQVPGRYTWINGSNAQTISHELGHNFGSHHASSLSCTDANGARVAISATCSSSEYGDPFDVMGRGFRHMNVFNKGRVGFLEAGNTATVTTDGTYTVAPLETKSTGVQALRVPIDGTLYYYVELRQPSTVDAFATTSSVVNGVLLHRAPDYGTLQRPQLIDTTPETTSYTDAALAVGKTFRDPVAGISITLQSVTSTGATVLVDVK